MAEMKAQLRIDLVGNLPQEAGRFGRAIQEFAGRSREHLERMNGPLMAMSRQLGDLSGRWTALASGAAMAAAARQITQLEHRVTMLSINAGTTPEQARASKEALFETARQRDIRLRPEALMAAEERVVEVTGDVQFAERNRRNMGLLMRATDAQGEAVGALFGELNKAAINTEKDVMQVIDTLNVQGKAGAFTIKDMARLGPRFVNALGARRKVDVAAMRDAGAALQVMMMGIGSAEPTVTAFEAILRTLSDEAKVEGTKSAPGIRRDWGVEVWDPAARAQGSMQMRPLTDIMREIITATRGDPTQLGSVFPAEAMPGMNFLAAEYNKTGGFATLDKLLNVAADGTQTQADAARAAQDTSAIVEGLGAAVEHAADKYLSPMVRTGADRLDALSVSQQDTALAGGGLALGSLVGSGLLAQVASAMGSGALATFSAGASVALGGVVAPAAAGATAGTLAYEQARGTASGDEVGAVVANLLAGLGVGSAREAIAASADEPTGLSGALGGLLERWTASLQTALDAIGPGAASQSAAPGEAGGASAASAAAGEVGAAADAAARADAAVGESRAASEAAQAQSIAASEAAQAQSTGASQEAQAASIAASQAAQSAAAAAAAQAQSAAAQAAAAAATVAKGIHGEIRIQVTGPAQVTSVTASGPVDVTAGGAYTGAAGATP